MKIYTKTGDEGETSLFGGERVWKDNIRIQSYGTVDELNALIGVTVSEIKDEKLILLLYKIQNTLFTVGADLASPIEKVNKNFSAPRIDDTHIKFIEDEIDYYDSRIEPLKQFILPGGTKGASLLHLCRTVCRRAETLVVRLSREVEIGSKIIVYLNRLSDLFFVLARYENSINGTPDTVWKK